MAHFSVQEIVKNPIDDVNNIPSRYIVEDQIEFKTSVPSIPTFDMNTFLDPQTKTGQLHEFHRACQEWGIFQLVNHGVDSLVLNKLKHELREFYNLPLEDRLRYRVRPEDFEGYGQKEIGPAINEKVDWVDRFFMIINPVNKRKPHLMPELPLSLRETLEAYISEQQKLALAILGLISETLGIDAREMKEVFEDGMQSIRMNYYPPCREANKVMGLRAHSDGSGITILLQVNGVEGLQVKKDGVWMGVKALPDALLVNLGDVIEIMSNGIYNSIEHRAVVNSEKERITIGMFINPKLEAEVGPSPSLLRNQHQQPLFRTVKAHQYVKEFFSRKIIGKSFLNYMKIE